MKRSVLSASNAVPSPTFQQSWALEARGDQASTTKNESTTTRPFNRADETTSAPGGAAPAYDDAGNTTAKDGRAYFYDALRRRTVEASGGTTTAVDFSGSTPIEERIGAFGDQNLIGVTGRVAFRDVFTDVTLGSGWNADWRTYAQQDANGDVVALVGNGAAFVGNARERYADSPYGVASFLDASGSPSSSSSFAWRQLFQGGRLDAATGLYVFGFRDYDPAAGVWMQRAPIGLAGGDANLYRFTGNNPVNYTDPLGLWSWGGVATRIGGALQATGGLLMTLGGGSLLITPEPALTKVAGAGLVVVGLDNYTNGMNTLLYGTTSQLHTDAFLSDRFVQMGATREDADWMASVYTTSAMLGAPLARIRPSPGLPLYRQIPRSPSAPSAKPASSAPAGAGKPCPTPGVKRTYLPPIDRHRLEKVRPDTRVRNSNTVYPRSVDVAGDVRDINAGLAARDSSGNFVVNGRIYGVEPSGRLYPISGEGFTVMDRGAYKALGIFNVYGDAPEAVIHAELNRLNHTAIERGRATWRANQ